MKLFILKILVKEGLYSNDKDDNGKETVYGISRKYNPDWCGWKIVDKLKSNPKFPEIMSENQNIYSAVLNYYKAKFEKMGISELNDDDLQYRIFDAGVNIGVRTAIKHFQSALNIINTKKAIEADGFIGKKTLKLYRELREKKSYLIKNIIKLINYYQTGYYIDLGQDKYINGWINNRIF